MASDSYDSDSSHGSHFLLEFHRFTKIIRGDEYRGCARGGSLVLDSVRGELVKYPVVAVKKEVSKAKAKAKAMAALKRHREAESRRRKRINAHLETLRSFVPCPEKMDKATLLAEIIQQVKELKKKATEASKGLLLPTEVDEVRVEPHDILDGTLSFRASVYCDYRPELLSLLKQALDTLHVNAVKAEISTLGGRMTNAFVFTSCKQEACNSAKANLRLAGSVHRALSSILMLDKAYTSATSPAGALLNPKTRRRISHF